MKFFIISYLLLCGSTICAQDSWKKKVFGGKNQFEIGNTFVNYLNQDQFNNYQFTKYNLYLSYSRLFNNRHLANTSFTSFESPVNFNQPIGAIVGSYFKLISFGYGYKLNYSKLDIYPNLNFSYRYFGGQRVIFGYRNFNSLLSEPLFADLFYNSLGGSIGLDVNYFLTNYIGFGFRSSYNFYPFEKAKLNAGSSLDQPDPFLVATHKPLNQMIVLNFKLIVRL